MNTYPKTLVELEKSLDGIDLLYETRKMLFWEANPDNTDFTEGDLPYIPPRSRVNVYHSAVSKFYAPSDLSGIYGMRTERIRAMPKYGTDKLPRYDTVFVEIDPEQKRMPGLSIARVLMFFSFKHFDQIYSCALIHWFDTVGEEPDTTLRMWKVSPSYLQNRKKHYAVINLKSILRAAHLMPCFQDMHMPDRSKLMPHNTLDSFKIFYVNKFIDYHTHELIS